jgi:heterodisulfide reductase subunit B
MKKKNITVFWGCTINDRLPFLEKTTRLVLDTLGYEVVDPQGLTCCPDPVFGKGLDPEEWLGLAARNLAICRNHGDELLVPCNGCLATFVKASAQLKDKAVRDKINQKLRQSGLEYNTSPRILHILSFFNRIGAETLNKSFLYRLSGLKVGVHYGCHILNTPSAAVDIPDDPKIFEKILSSTGLEATIYEERLLCCGGSTFSFDQEGSLGLLRQKFLSAKKQGLDALVLCCPLCFVQFDMQSKKLEDDESLPVFYITEIMALAMGISEKDLHFDWHVNKPQKLLEQKLKKTLNEEMIQSQFDMKRLAECCGACTYECSAARGFQDNDSRRFDPVSLVKQIVEGKWEQVLSDPDIWRCLKCHECSRQCPFGDGLPELFEKLQKFALQTGIQAKPFEQKIDLIRKTGAGIPRNPAIRREFGLPPMEGIDSKDLDGILERKS